MEITEKQKEHPGPLGMYVLLQNKRRGSDQWKVERRVCGGGASLQKLCISSREKHVPQSAKAVAAEEPGQGKREEHGNGKEALSRVLSRPHGTPWGHSPTFQTTHPLGIGDLSVICVLAERVLPVGSIFGDP